MHNLDQLILEWRQKEATPNVSTEALDELETHLRESTEQLVRSGMPVSNAFQRAVTELGTMPGISSEFRKLDQPIWLPVKLAMGVTRKVKTVEQTRFQAFATGVRSCLLAIGLILSTR